MKAILEFDLSDPDDRILHAQCVHAQALVCAISDFREDLRKIWKYSQDEVAVKWAEHWRNVLGEKLVDLPENIL